MCLVYPYHEAQTQHPSSPPVHQCNSWPGPISAAMYIALDSSFGPNKTGAALDAAITQARAFHALAERNMACQLDLMLVYERFSSARATVLYPVNTLRNYARLQARTPLVGLFDADMLPSLTLFIHLSDPEEVKR